MRRSGHIDDLIRGWEALALEAYPDPLSALAVRAFELGIHYTKVPAWRTFKGDPWTIGFGHTGPDVTPGLRITRERAEHLLQLDLRIAESSVSDLTSGCTLTQGQFDALVSFVFNEGRAALRTSTLLKKLMAGDLHGAANEFLRWDKGGRPKRPVASLTRRRGVERKMFLGESDGQSPTGRNIAPG